MFLIIVQVQEDVQSMQMSNKKDKTYHIYMKTEWIMDSNGCNIRL